MTTKKDDVLSVIKKPITVKYPVFNLDEPNPYQEEMDKLTTEAFADASTARTLKNIKETLAKDLRSKYAIQDKERLNHLVKSLLDLHGLTEKQLDSLSLFSELISTENTNDVSIDGNANKTNKNIAGLMGELNIVHAKLIGYDYLYRVMKELYGIKEAKRLSAEMYDYSLALNDSTQVLKPYCYCIDASKIVSIGREFGQVHSKPAQRAATYISTLGDTVRELAFNLAGAIAIGTFFLDIANLLIYKERVSLTTLKTNPKERKRISNLFEQFIYTVNHYSRNAIESPFTNISCFDYNKLKTLINEENYAWYFPKKTQVLVDNNLGGEDYKVSAEEYTDFVIDYIMTLQELYLDVFDKGDPLKGGLQFPFPVTTINIDNTSDITNNRLVDYITKKDISRYNIYTSEGTKMASCCRLISDTEAFSEFASSVNAFGGSSVSLGSARVVTINFARIAYETQSYEDFLSIMHERVDAVAKILKAHRILILKMKDKGLQPFISNGWINFNRMFGTFGCLGYVEAANVLREKFNKDFDYLKDFMQKFNQACYNKFQEKDTDGKKVYNFPFNIEQIPGEGLSPKLAKADKLIYSEHYAIPELYANQFVSLWEDHTIHEKMQRDGELGKLLTGGGIVHIQVDTKLTQMQAKALIKEAISVGCAHFALNCVYTHCTTCNTTIKGNSKICTECGSTQTEHYTRVIGFFSKVEAWELTRRTLDFPYRRFANLDQIRKE